MQLLLRKSGYVFHTSAEKEVVRMIKEKVSYVAADPKREEKEWSGAKVGDGKVVEYALPDGNKIKVSSEALSSNPYANKKKVGAERFRAPEILFDPEIIGLEYPGIHQIVVDAINRTDLDLRKSLFGNIVLSGGTETSGERYEDQDLCTARKEILDVDWRQYSGGFEYIQKGM
jgi:centractin